ncbi:MAG: VanW family protein [Clostridia bacterium]|nr:VanW family protein [Clostridia bacterium]
MANTTSRRRTNTRKPSNYQRPSGAGKSTGTSSASVASSTAYRRRRRPPKKNNDFLKLIALLAILAFLIVVIVCLSRCGKDDTPKKAPATKTTAVTQASSTKETEPTETEEAASSETVGSDVLATFSTDNMGNWNRTVNLELACAAINGTIVQPGAIFSFNQTVGERTEEKGYLPASIYSAGDVKEETGGGICQVASTLYLVAMKSDLEIVERHVHQFAVSYIPLGMDASIYWGDQDLRFRNTSGHPIIIYANTNNGCVNITICGTKKDTNYIFMDHEVIETYEPQEREKIDWTQEPGYEKVTQTPITGYYVQTYRCLYAENGDLLERTKMAVSVYNVRDKITTVGPPEEEETEPTEPSPPPQEEEPTDAPFPDPPDEESP